MKSFEDPPPWQPRFDDLGFNPPQNSRRPLDPPPPCFSTRSPLRIKSNDFPPFLIPAVTDDLAQGFRILYPHAVLECHGLFRADWIRFLEDLAITARLAAEGRPAIGRVPVPALLAHRVFPARGLGAAFGGRFARGPVEQVRALIQMWNQCAFERRKIRVSLQVRGDASGMDRCALVVESL